MDVAFPFDNSYARLPARFYARLAPTPVAAPRLIRLNRDLARALGLDPDGLETPEAVAVFAGMRVPQGAEPLAMAYAGHQFGQFVPQLGDGRALLLGEVVDPAGHRFDVQLKGSGPTPFSRRGDGRAALGPVLREYIVSEAMAALGIPTTRSLAAVATGETVVRETLLPGAVLTRVARSHVRVGTFQYFAARGDREALSLLVAHVIERLYPEAAAAPVPARALLEGVIERQARLVAQWLLVGFIHGVMNTDNMSIAGETIDYGPCAFLDTYHPETVFSSIDQFGRYAYANQPQIAVWNLARFAETLLPLIGETDEAAIEEATTALGTFGSHFTAALAAGFRAKLGLVTAEAEDLALAQAFLAAMADGEADFTLAFRHLAEAAEEPAREEALSGLFAARAGLEAFLARWRARLAREPEGAPGRAQRMRAANPAVIPRNHRVEAAIRAAVEDGDLAPFERLMALLATPFTLSPAAADFALPPRPEERVTRTFCGT